ncbi:hypothetical protein BJP25_23505 [Actinokineospora bangkokensis]|uniref:Uncharacterized protein n=1 Tax=Actinokineospora bangkokensis TaxID=1193682 RepID=A0A1Q9LIH6_9PSEU|nr:hypothetical protein BJP25_23505 [Actinokineospora bangkokensis]
MITALAAVFGVVGLVSPASAAAGPSAEQLFAAADRVVHLRASAADRALLASVPEVADKVVDPARTKVEFDRGQPAKAALAGGAGTAAKTGVGAQASEYNWAYVKVTYYSTTGFQVYTWRQYVEWYYDYVVVTGWKNRLDFIDYNDGTANFSPGFYTNYADRPGGRSAVSVMQKAVQHCWIQYGCWGWSYPRTQINTFYNGTATWSSFV